MEQVEAIKLVLNAGSGALEAAAGNLRWVAILDILWVIFWLGLMLWGIRYLLRTAKEMEGGDENPRYAVAALLTLAALSMLPYLLGKVIVAVDPAGSILRIAFGGY